MLFYMSTDAGVAIAHNNSNTNNSNFLFLMANFADFKLSIFLHYLHDLDLNGFYDSMQYNMEFGISKCFDAIKKKRLKLEWH